MLKLGVIITKGLQNWQILQQENGAAALKLSGEYYPPEGAQGAAHVFVRAVREDSGDCILPWTECTLSGGNRWRVSASIPAGGLYRAETCLHMGEPVALEWGTRGDMIHHFGVGDLYVIAGQSNSAGYGKDPAWDPPEMGVHVLRDSGNWDLASHPLNDSTGTIHEVNREASNSGTSPWLSFGRMMKRETGIPVGLLQTALGGSSLERWNPEEEGSLYRNLLETVSSQGGKIRGVLWYQGCEDTAKNRAETYLTRFTVLVRHLRQDTGLPELPFFTVQLNRYMREPVPGGNEGWAAVREAQRLAARTIPFVYLVPSIDATLSDAIHNSSVSNVTLGERTAKMALAKLFGRNFICMSPDLRSAAQTGKNEITLLIDNVCSRIYDYNVNPEKLPFSAEDAGGIQSPAAAVFEGNRIILRFGRELRGACRISCAGSQNPAGVVPVDYEGHLPLIPFYRVKAEPLPEPEVPRP